MVTVVPVSRLKPRDFSQRSVAGAEQIQQEATISPSTSAVGWPRPGILSGSNLVFICIVCWLEPGPYIVKGARPTRGQVNCLSTNEAADQEGNRLGRVAERVLSALTRTPPHRLTPSQTSFQQTVTLHSWARCRLHALHIAIDTRSQSLKYDILIT